MLQVASARRALAIAATAVGLLALAVGCTQKGAGGDTARQVGAAGAVSSVTGYADLAGTWKLNVELSDPPPGARPDSGWQRPGPPPDSGSRLLGPPPDSGWQHPGPPPDSGRHHPGRPPGDSLGRGPGPGGHMGPPLTPPQFTITQTDSAITFTADRGPTMTLRTDSSITVSLGDSAHQIQLRAYWNESDTLVIECRRGDSSTIVEAFSLVTGQRQLVVTTHIEDSHLEAPITFRRVYDPVSAGS